MGEEYKAGQAWFHSNPHNQLGNDEGTEPTELTIVFFNVRHGDPLPVVGNQADPTDFSKAPPASCPRLC